MNLRFVKVVNDVIVNYQYTLDDLRVECPTAQIYRYSKILPDPSLLKNYNVYPLITTKKPDGPTDNVVTELPPIFNGEEWIQQWESRTYTEQEKIFLQDQIKVGVRVAVDELLRQAAENE